MKVKTIYIAHFSMIGFTACEKEANVQNESANQPDIAELTEKKN